MEKMLVNAPYENPFEQNDDVEIQNLEIDEVENTRLFFKTYDYDEMRMVHLDTILDDIKNYPKNEMIKVPFTLLKFNEIKGTRSNWLPMVYIAMMIIRSKYNARLCSIEDIVDFLGYCRNTTNYNNVKKAIYKLYEKRYITIAINEEEIDLSNYKLTRTKRFRCFFRKGYNGNLIKITTNRIKYILENTKDLNIFITMNTYLKLYYWKQQNADKKVVIATDKFFKDELGVKSNASKLEFLKKMVELDLLYVVTQGNILSQGRIMSCPYFISVAKGKDFVYNTLFMRDYYLMNLEDKGCTVYFSNIDTHCMPIDVEYKKQILAIKAKLRSVVTKDEVGNVDIVKLSEQEKELEEWRVQYRTELSEYKYKKEHPVFGDPDSTEVKYNPTVLTREQFRQMKNDRIKYATYKPNIKKDVDVENTNASNLNNL